MLADELRTNVGAVSGWGYRDTVDPVIRGH